LLLRTGSQSRDCRYRGDTDDDTEHGQKRAHFVRPYCRARHTKGLSHPVNCAAPASARRVLADGTGHRRGFGYIALVGNDDAVADLYNPIRMFGDLLVVSDENDGVPLGVKLAQDLHDFGATVRIQRSGRFVGQNYLAAIHQRAGDRHPLLLAARKLARNIARPLGEPQPGQQGDRSLVPVGSAASGIDGRHLDVAGRAEIAKQMIALEDETKTLTA